MKKTSLTLLILSLFLINSCDSQKPAEETKEQPVETKISEKTTPSTSAQIKLIPKSFSDLKNWPQDNPQALIKAFKDSCEKIALVKDEFLSNAAAKIPTKIYQEVCNKYQKSNIKTAQEFKNFVEQNFTPYLVTNNDNEEGKFTSYYETSIHASYHKSDKYKYPIYGKPYDLIEFNAHDFDKSAPDKRYTGRIVNQKLVPYYTREEISKKPINAPILLWGDSLVDINIMQIQGSAVATLDNGEKVRVGYADNNSHPFKGIGSILLSKGLVKPGEASMLHIKKWLKKHPEQAEELYNENKRFIFHRFVKAEGPIGGQGVPLHAGRSLAVDKSYIPLGSLLWLETKGPNNKQLEKLVIAQDIGSAIKGIVRGDYFWGSGADEVLEHAGKMNQKGRYFIMLPNKMIEE